MHECLSVHEKMASSISVSSVVVLVISLVANFSLLINSAKIVALPFFAGSHYIGMKQIGQELAKRGHQFTILVSSDRKVKPAKGITHGVYHVPYEEDILKKHVAQEIHKGRFKTYYYGNLSLPTLYQTFCEHLIKDRQLLEPLKDSDLLITDCGVHTCGLLLSDYLGVRRVEYCAGPPRVLHLLDNYASLSMASYVPMFMSVIPSKMNFLQRVKNLLNIIAVNMVAIPFIAVKPVQDLRVKYDIKPEKGLLESMTEDIKLGLFVADFALEHAYPIPPHYKMIGPLNIQPVKPLPPDLQQLIDSSGNDGVIIVSFGTIMATFPKAKVDIMAEAFGRLKQKVIWRLKGYIPSSLSPNIKTVSWLPQNDLLSQEKLRLFVSHVGQNSLNEAAYHGVPVVAIPLFVDQFDNAVLMESRKIGISLDFHKLTADDLYNTIKRVIKDPSYRENAQRISRLMQDRPRSPVQEAGDWIEYALRHESLSHLRPYSSQLDWYQYFLVDVAVFLVLVVLVLIMVIKYTVCFVCCRQKKKEKRQ